MAPIKLLTIDGLPGSRHGVEGPTAVLRWRWQGARPERQALMALQERLAHGLWFLERLAWNPRYYSNWRACRSSIPERPFPQAFLLGPAVSPLADLLAAGLTALQWGALMPVSSARVLSDDGEEMVVAVPYRLPQTLQAALTLLGEIAAAVMAVDAAEPQDWRPALEQAIDASLGKRQLDEDGAWMAWQAWQRGLPVARIDFGVVEIGHGASRRRFLGSLSGMEAVVSVLASNKLATKRQLLRAGVPVPEHRLVQNEEEALAAAQELGWPVVLKPIDQSLARGVTANLWRVPDLLRAYRGARAVSQKPLLLERHAPGFDHRIVVLDGAVIAAMAQPFVTVRGDGFSSLQQLIDRARAACADPEAAACYGLDSDVRRRIDAQGLSLDDVVESRRVVRLRVVSGPPPFPSIWFDALDVLHPELAQLAIRAASVLGVRLAGLDVISPDVSRPPLSSGAVVLEINPRPWLRLARFCDNPRQIDRRVFEAACPEGYRSIPVLLLDGSAAAGALLQQLEAELEAGGAVIGSWSECAVERGLEAAPEAGLEAAETAAEAATAPVVRIGGEPVVWVTTADSREAPGELVLSDGRVELALLNLSAESWQRQGFPCLGCSAGVLMGGEELLTQGLLAEWLAGVRGPVLVVGGAAALLTAVREQVGDRLLAVADGEEALERLRQLLTPESGGG